MSKRKKDWSVFLKTGYDVRKCNISPETYRLISKEPVQQSIDIVRNIPLSKFKQRRSTLSMKELDNIWLGACGLGLNAYRAHISNEIGTPNANCNKTGMVWLLIRPPHSMLAMYLIGKGAMRGDKGVVYMLNGIEAVHNFDAQIERAKAIIGELGKYKFNVCYESYQAK